MLYKSNIIITKKAEPEKKAPQPLLPVPEELRAAAAAFNADPMAWILAGGDDHALLAAFPAGTPLPDGFRRIGLVEPAGELPVLVAGQRWSGETGHEHFRR